MQRDRGDHVRFCPIQSRLGQQLCKEHGAPSDASTAVLIEYEHGLVHTESSAVLRLFPWMGFPWTAAGFAGLLVPSTVRDSAYRGFARNRGQIWVWVKDARAWVIHRWRRIAAVWWVWSHPCPNLGALMRIPSLMYGVTSNKLLDLHVLEGTLARLHLVGHDSRSRTRSAYAA